MPLPPNVPGTLGLALIVIQQSQRETLGPRVPGWPKLGAQAGPVYCATGVPSRAARSLDSTRARPPAGPGPCGGVAPGRMGRQACGAGPWRQLSRAPVWDPGPKRNPGTAALPPSLCTVAAPGLTPRPKLGGEPPARGVPGILQVGNAPRPVRGVNGVMNEHYAPATGKIRPFHRRHSPAEPPSIAKHWIPSRRAATTKMCGFGSISRPGQVFEHEKRISPRGEAKSVHAKCVSRNHAGYKVCTQSAQTCC